MLLILRFACCLMLAALLAPAPVSLAKDTKQDSPAGKAEPVRPVVRQFSNEEISAARASLADLTPEQRVAVNHLRFLLRPQYEAELMAGRAFAPCLLPSLEQPVEAIDSAEALRLWAVLVSGMPLTEPAQGRLRLFCNAPVPAADENLAELGLQMAVCAQALRRSDTGLGDALRQRASDLLEAAQDARRATDDSSSLIAGKVTQPKWYANQLWRSLICTFALELELKVSERIWESALRNLLRAGGGVKGWRSKATDNSEVEDLDSNLYALAALGLASAAPEGTLGKGLARSIETALQDAPALLARLDRDFPGVARSGSRLAMICSLPARLAPEGTEAAAWRESRIKQALDAHDASGAVRDGRFVGRELGLGEGLQALRVSETTLSCVALGGGLAGREGPLSGLSVAAIGRAMHACSVLHAGSLPEGRQRITTGQGHELPEAREIEAYMVKGMDFLINAQSKEGGWGSGWGGARSGTPAGTIDVGTTAFVGLALLRAGYSPLEGDHAETLLNATRYVVTTVDKAAEDGPRVTDATGTQLQGKLGQIVDTAVVTQFLARVLALTEGDRKLYEQVEAALDKCIRKIEAAQDQDGGWITQGWAPVLQSAMFNQALELAELAGRPIDPEVLGRSRTYLCRDVAVDDKKTTAADPAKRSTSAGIAFYAGSSALRATAGDAAEVMIAMEHATKNRKLPAGAEVSDANLRKIGYDEADATAKATAYKAYEVLREKLDDESYLKGFGNNGGEEFISYMLSSESMVITGHEAWETWNEKMHNTFSKIQNTDGSWSGHHCITSPVLCTAAVLLCLTADREVHVLVEDGPQGKTVASKDSGKKKARSGDGPVTGD